MISRHSLIHFFPPEDLSTVKLKMLNWLRRFGIFAYLDNNEYVQGPNRFELLAGWNPVSQINRPPDEAGDWHLGHIAYDYKNTLLDNTTRHRPDPSLFSDCYFFRPETVAYIPYGKTELHIETLLPDPKPILHDLLHTPDYPESRQTVQWQLTQNKSVYFDTVNAIRNHIQEGDCYELNLCLEATTTASIDPVAVFHRLNQINPAPFAACYRNHNSYCLAASPERFLYKSGSTILSQPIKGTIGKGRNDLENEEKKAALLNDEKERAENVMIVDLVRSDLARCCETGTVSVPELFGVYTFPQLFHLISTVQGKLRQHCTFSDLIRAAFPMGSMTGAPKRRVMELIDQYEPSTRGLYSGTIGYLMPNGDFDCNVVIRSLFFEAATKRLSYQAGGAITYDSRPENEWKEMLLKASAMSSVC